MRSASSPRAVSMITGSSERARIQRQSSSPSTPGSMTSSTTRSGGSCSSSHLGRPTVSGLARRVAGAFEVAHGDLAHDGLVVHDEDGRHAHIVSPRPCGGVNSGLRKVCSADRHVRRKERRVRSSRQLSKEASHATDRVPALHPRRGCGAWLSPRSPPTTGRCSASPRTRRLASIEAATVAYLDFGPVKLAAGNKVAPIWAFTNGGTAGSATSSTPSRDAPTTRRSGAYGSSPGASGQTARVLRSAAAVRRAAAAGQVSIKAMPIVVNCPVL